MTMVEQPWFPARRTAREASDSPYLTTAIAIGERLVSDAETVAGGVLWSGDDLAGSDESNLRVVHGYVGPDLYGGAAGIAWFLGHLACVTDEPRFADVSLAAMNLALANAEQLIDEGQLSLYAGATGIALTAMQLAGRLALPELAAKGDELASRVAVTARAAAPVGEDDLLGGSSGVVAGLLAIHRHNGNPELLETCRVVGHQLASSAHHDWWGASWAAPNTQPALCGLGHGMSGIGWALAETAWATNDESLLAVALEAFRYERSFFSRDAGTWPDLRGVSEASGAEMTSWTTAWCHGALGIGAVRLRVFEETQDLSALADASAAIQAARAISVQAARAAEQGGVRDVTLCHGIGGIAELFLLAAEVFRSTDHYRAARRVGSLMQRFFEENDRTWPCGLPGAQHIPGLFLGLAGIGVTMMRLDDPTSIGSPMLAGRPPVSAILDPTVETLG